VTAVCSNCGADNSAGVKFCGECGVSLRIVCQACNTPNEPGRKFCGECGAALTTASRQGHSPSAAVEAPVAERRLVSVLFADLVGFTSLSESRDPEEVRELLSRYFDTCRRLVGLYGGLVEKFIGDAVMAVWGTPVATEDDAERAVRAALDLVTAVSALGDELGAPELRARAGVLTGEAAVTIGAEGQGMVAGDLVNTASRVQAAAQPGTVYVGEATRRATAQTVAFEEAGSFALKGKEGETTLWRALRVVSGRRGSLRSEGLEPPFVGRDRELRQLKELFHSCAEEGRAHLVSVTGIAGIGKSRLAWEFYKYFDGIIDPVLWHRGRSLAYGEGITYWALADMVRWRCGITEDEPAPDALGKVRATLDEYVSDAEDRRFLEPRLAQLLGLGDFEGSDRQEMFAAWRLFLESLAAATPTVLVFEDLQWADSSLLDFIEYLLDAARSQPLFVVTLARPELLERRPTWGAGQPRVTSWHLEPLAQDAMEALLEGLVPGLPTALRARILERAEGVPLYAVETVRMLLDRGLVLLDGPVYRPAGEIDALEVPETLHALVAARLDGLGELERRLLQDAAVLGKTFRVDGLAALSGTPTPEINPVLASLVRKEVLSVQADSRSPEYGQYGFLQDLVRRVAYETLSKRERRARHLAAADFIAVSLGEEEAAEIVASHLLDAHRELPHAPDAADVKDRARAALVRAGERAEQLAAPGEAHRYYRHAIELADDAAERARLAERAGRMASRSGELVEAKAQFTRAYEGFEALGDRRAAALVAAQHAEVDFMDGDPGQAVEKLEPALAALEADDAADEIAELEAQLARFLWFAGDHEHVGAHLERALALAGPRDLVETIAGALMTKAMYLDGLDRRDEARIALEGALALALSRDLRVKALRAYNNLAGTLQEADPRRALATANAGIELAPRVGHAPLAESLGYHRAWAFRSLGRWDEAVAALDEGGSGGSRLAGFAKLLLIPVLCARAELERARQVLTEGAANADSSDRGAALWYLESETIVLREEGRREHALATAQRLVAATRETGELSAHVTYGVFVALETAVTVGDLDAARSYLAEVEALMPGQLTPYQAAQRERFRGNLSSNGQDEHFAAAEARFSEGGWVFEEAVTSLDHAAWLIARDSADRAAPLLERARETFEQLNAGSWLQRLEVIEAELGTEIPA
jgi:class 3 adenylate cyclase/tetratricopeptide (TPR) repeat protein